MHTYVRTYDVRRTYIHTITYIHTHIYIYTCILYTCRCPCYTRIQCRCTCVDSMFMMHRLTSFRSFFLHVMPADRLISWPADAWPLARKLGTRTNCLGEGRAGGLLRAVSWEKMRKIGWFKVISQYFQRIEESTENWWFTWIFSS